MTDSDLREAAMMAEAEASAEIAMEGERAMDSERAAAGPWQTGEPPNEGRYLIQYRPAGGRVEKVFIGDWIHPGRWSSLLDAEVLRWAEINEPEATDE